MKKEAAPVVPEAPKAEVPADAPKAEEPKVDAPVVETKQSEERKLKAIFVSKTDFKNSYWVVTDDGKPVLKASLGDIWGDKLSEVSDYAASPVYGEALLQRMREDGVKKVALLTNATVYVEAADQRGQVGKGDEWPSQKSIGKDQYSPAGPEGHAKLKKLPEGIDMSGGDTGAGAAGPSAGKGDQSPSSKSVGKDQYKHAGGGGPKVKSEYMEKEAAAEPKAEPIMDIPATPPAEMPVPEATPEAAPEMSKGPLKPVAEMSDEEKLALMKELVDSMDPSKKTAKPLAQVEKSVEKLEVAVEKEKEIAEKEAAKEAEKAAKEAEKAAKEAEKAAAKDAKAAEKEEKAEPKEEKVEPKEEKVEPKEEKAAEKEEPMEKKAAAPEALAPTLEVVPTLIPEVSSREQELEQQLIQLKLEQSLRAKTLRCHALINEMVDKDLISVDDSDVQEEIKNGKPLFDARAAAFKKAMDKQCRDLLAMEDVTLHAFAQTVNRMKGRAVSSQSGVLKKAFKLQYDEHINEDSWLKDTFNNMGSQKGKI
jgi:hypothetical protein